ncbi:hypothetical protein VTN96DRAFT_820 [Rasamsonia emersonii]
MGQSRARRPKREGAERGKARVGGLSRRATGGRRRSSERECIPSAGLAGHREPQPRSPADALRRASQRAACGGSSGSPPADWASAPPDQPGSCDGGAGSQAATPLVRFRQAPSRHACFGWQGGCGTGQGADRQRISTKRRKRAAAWMRRGLDGGWDMGDAGERGRLVSEPAGSTTTQ